MKDRVHFYSTRDLSIPFNLRLADAVIEKYQEGWRPDDANDVTELYCIMLFVENGICKNDWSEDTLQLIRSDFKKEVVSYYSKLKRDTWVPVYKQLELGYKEFFWEIIAKYDFDRILDRETIHEAIVDNDWQLHDLLRQERLVAKLDQVLVDLLKMNEHSAEWLLKEYVECDTFGGGEKLFFPKALSYQDKEDIISRYLDSEVPNLNYVRLIRVARKDHNLRLSDLLKLKASKVEKRLNDHYFHNGNTISHKYGVEIINNPGRPWRWVEGEETGDVIYCYSKDWLLKFKGYSLLHCLGYCFEFLSPDGMVTLVAKDSDSDAFERATTMRGKYSYPTNFVFQYQEAISLSQIMAIQKVLNNDGTNVEASVIAFYEQYLKEKYGYPSCRLSLADESADGVVKCRAIAPEIDAIAHRYDQYAKNGAVDDELLMLSADNVRVTDVQSTNHVRYYTIKGQPEELYKLFYLFFSEQSMLNYVEPYKNKRYRSFYRLLVEQDGKICYENFENYQLQDIDYLIESGYLSKGDDGMLSVEKFTEIVLLKELYEYHSIPIRANNEFENLLLREMEQKGWLETDNHLLSMEERHYFEYYMYNSRYTNGPALRNRYSHGSHDDPTKESVHQANYNRLLLLLVLELLKIEEDLILGQLMDKAMEEDEHSENKYTLLGPVSDIGPYSCAQPKFADGEYLKMPKKYGVHEGYVYANSIKGGETNVYYIKPHSGFTPEYISFLLNSSIIRLVLAKDSMEPVSLTIEDIQSLTLPVVPINEQQIYASLEHILSELFARGEERSDEENLQYNVLSALRDYLCLELLRPDFTVQHNLEFIKPFMDIMQQLEGGGVDIPSRLLELIIMSDNPLGNNMKKGKAILEDENNN